MLDVEHWLSQLHTNGTQLDLKQLLYYRARSHLLDLTPRKAIQAKLAGTYLAKTKGRGMEFDEARHYQPGDDIRAIDWRVTARTGRTHTKVYREEKERPVFILADLSSSMYFGTQFLFKSVQAAHLASLIAWSAKNRGDRIGGLIFNQTQHIELKPQTRQKAVLELLNALIKLHRPEQPTEQQISFADACARLRRLAHPGSLIFLLSDFLQLDDRAKQHLAHVSRHSEIIAYPISDPFEHELPKVKTEQQVAISNGQEQQLLTLGEKRTALQYKSHQAHEFELRDQLLALCKARVTPISAALPLEQQLINLSRRSK